jgi:hypothetical protein
MKIGQLVKVVDWDSSGGFATPDEFIGLVVGVVFDDQIPPVLEVLLENGTIYKQYADELELVK